MQEDSDEHLVRYLLGELPESEAARLDELSITDDALALRLRVLENDLADRYARGEALAVSVDRVERRLRESAHLRGKVLFAEALRALATDAGAHRARSPAQAGSRAHSRGPRPVLRSALRWWNVAAAAVLVLAAAGYLGLRNVQLRDEVGRLEAQRAEIERRNAELQEQLLRTPPAAPALSPVTATFLLHPLRRGIDETTTVPIPAGTELLTLRLLVESDEYLTFWAAVRDRGTNRVVWRSSDLAAEPSGGSDRIVTLTVPAGSLEARRYTVELSGILPNGPTELVGHYPIRLVLE